MSILLRPFSLCILVAVVLLVWWVMLYILVKISIGLGPFSLMALITAVFLNLFGWTILVSVVLRIFLVIRHYTWVAVSVRTTVVLLMLFGWVVLVPIVWLLLSH